MTSKVTYVKLELTSWKRCKIGFWLHQIADSKRQIAYHTAPFQMTLSDLEYCFIYYKHLKCILKRTAVQHLTLPLTRDLFAIAKFLVNLILTLVLAGTLVLDFGLRPNFTIHINKLCIN